LGKQPILPYRKIVLVGGDAPSTPGRRTAAGYAKDMSVPQTKPIYMHWIRGIYMRTYNKRIEIRLTETDYETMMSNVKKSGLSQSKYLRKCITRPVVIIEGLEQAVPQLIRIGGNINQVARHLNKTFYADSDTLRDLGAIEKELKLWLSSNLHRAPGKI
jgi:hypothetical protein